MASEVSSPGPTSGAESKDRPFVFINTAVTADGKIDTIERQGAPVSSASDVERVDGLRAESDAIMVGGYTLLHEDPRLTVKSPLLRARRVELGLPENPAKVGVVTRIPARGAGPTILSDGRFLNTGPARRLVFTTGQTEPAQIRRLREQGAEVLVVGEQTVDLVAALGYLKALGIRTLMVEGGGTLNAALLALGLVDEIRLYVAPLVFGGASAPTLVDGPGFRRNEAIPLQLRSVQQLGDGGLVLHYAL